MKNFLIHTIPLFLIIFTSVEVGSRHRRETSEGLLLEPFLSEPGCGRIEGLGGNGVQTLLDGLSPPIGPVDYCPTLNWVDVMKRRR